MTLAGYIVCVPALHLAIYSLAVLVACLVRHVTYAGILSMGATLFVVVIHRRCPEKSAFNAPARLNIDEVMPKSLPSRSPGTSFSRRLGLNLAIYLAYMFSIAAAATFAARWAVQKDISVRA